MSRQRSLEQDRAKVAWECVGQIKGRQEKLKKDYGSLARSAPASIQANGLGQTLAFWKSKPNDEEKRILYQQVSDWVTKREKDLLTWIINEAGTDDYRRATTEAIAFLSWLKRFAEAELPAELLKEND